jgi:hypothetical protein
VGRTKKLGGVGGRRGSPLLPVVASGNHNVMDVHVSVVVHVGVGSAFSMGFREIACVPSIITMSNMFTSVPDGFRSVAMSSVPLRPWLSFSDKSLSHNVFNVYLPFRSATRTECVMPEVIPRYSDITRRLGALQRLCRIDCASSFCVRIHALSSAFLNVQTGSLFLLALFSFLFPFLLRQWLFLGASHTQLVHADMDVRAVRH